MTLEFEWDLDKANNNETKHGVSFMEATEAFDDDYSSCVQDPDHSWDEDRYLIFGKSYKARYLVVAFTERNARIRIISAREMTSQERKAYEQ